MMQSVLVEVRPRLQACNVFLMMKEHIVDKDSVKLNLTSSGIEVHWENELIVFVQKIIIANERWKLMNISAVEIHKKAVTFRAQTMPVNSSSGSYSLEIISFNQSLNMIRGKSEKKTSPSISADTEYSLMCNCCSYVISKHNVKFNRILPLPSSSWIKTEWFCHKHANTPDYQNMALLPKPDDCFYGSCFVVLNSCLLKINNTNNVILCKRCISWLGKNDGDSVRLWNCTVDFGGVSQSTALEDFINVITESVNESVNIICKLLVYTQLANKTFHYLLMWVMDKDIEVLLGSNEETIKNASSDESSKPMCILKCSVNKYKAIKVLYNYHNDRNDIVKLWQKDINVQCMEIAKQMFLSGLDHLARGTQYLPCPQRVVNNFYVSYIGLR